jgi:hypothetical protein
MHLHYKRKFFFLYCLRSCFISDDWWLGSDTSTHSQLQVPDILDNAYVVVDYENGVRGMLDLCMFAEGSRNEQEICVVGTRGKGEAFVPESIVRLGARDSGREGVLTYEVHDKRVKYDVSSTTLPLTFSWSQ